MPPSANPADYGFTPLAGLLSDMGAHMQSEFKARAYCLDHRELVRVFQKAVTAGQRAFAFLLAEEMTARGIPPCFRYSPIHSPADATINQEFDYLAHDAQWIVSQYPGQLNLVRYEQSRGLFKATTFHKTAQFIYYYGQRPPGKIVGGLQLSDAQQWECYWLRSRHIVKQAQAIEQVRPRVVSAITERVHAACNRSFTTEQAAISIRRREALWVCSRMFGTSPTKVAQRYEQMTGERIGRNIVAKQLQAIENAVG